MTDLPQDVRRAFKTELAAQGLHPVLHLTNLLPIWIFFFFLATVLVLGAADKHGESLELLEKFIAARERPASTARVRGKGGQISPNPIFPFYQLY